MVHKAALDEIIREEHFRYFVHKGRDNVSDGSAEDAIAHSHVQHAEEEHLEGHVDPFVAVDECATVGHLGWISKIVKYLWSRLGFPSIHFPTFMMSFPLQWHGACALLHTPTESYLPNDRVAFP